MVRNLLSKVILNQYVDISLVIFFLLFIICRNLNYSFFIRLSNFLIFFIFNLRHCQLKIYVDKKFLPIPSWPFVFTNISSLVIMEGYENLACQVQNNLSWLETSYLSNLTSTWNIGNIDDKLMINWKSPDQGPWLWFYCKLNIRRGGQEHTVSRGKINQSNCNVFTTNSFIFLDKASETENCVSFV